MKEFTQLPALQGDYAFRYGDIAVQLPGAPLNYFLPAGDCDNFDLDPKPTIIKRFSKNAQQATLRKTAAVKFEGTVSFKLMQWGALLKSVAVLGNAEAYTQPVAGVGAEATIVTTARVGRYMLNGFKVSALDVKSGATVFVEGTNFVVDDAMGGQITVTSFPVGVVAGDPLTIKNQQEAILDTAGLFKNVLMGLPYLQVAILARELAAVGPQQLLYLPTVNLAPKSGYSWVGNDDWAGVEVEGDVLDAAGTGFGYTVDVPVA
jgi:hypothetical protein